MKRKIGIIIDVLNEDYQSRIFSGIYAYAKKNGIDITVFAGVIEIGYGEWFYDFEIIRKAIYTDNYDGFIVFTGTIMNEYSKNQIESMFNELRSLPVVSISIPINNVPAILIDNKKGIKELIKHLIKDHGCRKIAFIKGKNGNSEVKDRFDAYCTVLKENSLQINNSLIIDGKFGEKWGREAVDILTRKRKAEFDAVVCSDDLIAIGVIDALKNNGISVPDDVKVTGFDDIETAKYKTPALTTVRQPLFKQGYYGLKKLIDLINHQSGNGNTILDTEVIIRESCGCPPQIHSMNENEIKKFYYDNTVRNKNIWNYEVAYQKLNNAVTLERLKDIMYKELHDLGILSFYMVLYKNVIIKENPEDLIIPETSRLVAAFKDGKSLIEKSLEFSVKEFMPLDIFDDKNQKTYIFMVLAFEKEHFGYIYFEYMEERPNYIYFALRRQISSTLKNIYLLEEIAESEKQKTNLFVSLTHEIKTPLTLISNYLDKYIQKNGITPELKIISENVNKLNQDMINFLDVEKLKHGQVFYDHSQVFNLSAMIKNRVILFKEYAAGKSVKINFEITKDLFIKCDPSAMECIINNLLDNAIKYNKQDGNIFVKLTVVQNKIQLVVRDTGSGIDKKGHENVFNAYSQITSKKRNIKGSIGMGLYIVKKILDDINAKIELHSLPDKGAAFKIIFKKPESGINTVKAEAPEQRVMLVNHYPDAEPDNNDNKEEKFNILVVEDNKHMINFLKQSMKEYFNFFFAENGKDALKKLSKIPKPDMILSDIMMDVMGGYEFHSKLSHIKAYNYIPFIFLTAMSSKNDKIKGLKKGAVDYIYKPFHVDELLFKILNIIKRDKMLKRDLREKIWKKLETYVWEDINTLDYKKNERQSKYDKLGISVREVEIIELVSKGLTNTEIGKGLNISVRTVCKHIQNIYDKVNVNNRMELIKIFITSDMNPGK